MATNAERLAEAYADAETWIMRLIAEAVRREAHGTANTYMARLSELRELIREVDQALSTLDGAALSEVGGVLMDAWDDGVREAILTIPGEPAVPSGAITTLAIETAGALSSQRTAVLRSVQDAYREVIRDMSIRQSASGMNIDTAMQQALNKFAAKGITSFTDAAGRDWSMDTYTRMALRTSTNRAANEARVRSFEANDIQLVITSSHPAPAPMCAPYENRILSLDGVAGDRVVWDRVRDQDMTVHVTATMEEAEAAGYHHPNAILGGSQFLDGMGGVQAGSKGTYAGPAITIRTAELDWFTVSPHHPVLTGRGWVTAETVCEGDDLFRSVSGGAIPVDIVGTPDLNDVPPRVEQVFGALKDRFPVMSTPAAAHNFNDDRQFLKGEVHIVVPDRELLPVPDTHVVKETGEVRFDWSDMGGVDVVGGDPSCLGNAGVGHAGTVVRTLADSDPHGFKSSQQRRAGDSEHPGEVLAGLPRKVAATKVVSVQRDYFHGEAFDFQTETGTYFLNSILIHNCKHVDSAFIPGTEVPEHVPSDPADYEAKQRQRAMERHVRFWKRRKSVALTPSAEKKANAKIRAWQGQIKRHVDQHDFLSRQYSRERVFQGNPQNAV